MNNAFYFVVDEKLADIASAQALHIAKLWKCDVHIFVERAAPTAAVRTIDNVALIYHIDELSARLPAGLPSSKNWPHIVYLRLFVPQLLSHYDRLIYLDADVLCMKPAPEVWTIDLPSGLAAVEDFGTHFELPPESKHLRREEWLQTLGIYSGRGFNSGVLLIDPEKWLAFDIGASLLRYFSEYPHAKRFDQDFLSWLFDGSWAELGPRFNFQASLFSFGLNAAIDPVFIHFCQFEKPWFGWRGLGRTNLDEAYADIYNRLIRSVGADPASLAKPQRIAPYRKANFAIRRAMTRIGIPCSKERRMRRERSRRMKIFYDYINSRLSSGRLADEKRRVLPDVKDPEYFDGRYIRTDLRPLIEKGPAFQNADSFA